MKTLLLLMLCSVALAADTYPTLRTTSGAEYRQVRVSAVEADGITVFHAGGVAKLYFRELPPELQRKYGYDPNRAAAAEAADRAAQAALAEQAKRDAEAAAKARLEQEKQQAKAMREAERRRAAAGAVGGGDALKANDSGMTWQERRSLEKELARQRIVREVAREERAKDRKADKEARKREVSEEAEEK